MKKRINYFLFLFLILRSCFCFGQSLKVDSLITVLKTSKEDTTKVNILNNLFLEFEFTDDIKAGEYLNKALELSKRINYKKGLATTYIYLGYFAEDKGSYPEALKNYSASLEIYEEVGYKKGIADCYNSIGLAYYYHGNYPVALKNHFASLKIRETIGDKRGISASYNNIGIVYGAQCNYIEELKNHHASLKIKVEINDIAGIAYSYNNIGAVYSEQGNDKEALKNYTISLKIRESLGDKSGIADCYGNIGIVYKNQNNYPDALANNFACLKIKEEIEDMHGIATTYSNIGNLFIKQRKYKVAEEYYVKAKKIAKESGYKDNLVNIYKAFNELDSAKGDFKGAYENHKLYILYRDSLDNEETRKKTIQSQMTFDFEKKEAVAVAEHKKELENLKVLAEEKSRKQKIVILFVVIGFLLVVLFSAFIFRSLRVTKRQKNTIENQKNIVEIQKQEVEGQKLLVEEKQKEIIDSITYARRIQRALLPTDRYIDKILKRLYFERKDYKDEIENN